MVSYARHAFGDDDGGEGGATTEGILSYARHVVAIASIGDGGGNDDVAGEVVVFVVTGAALIRHLYGCFAGDVVADAAGLEVVCQRECGGKEEKEGGECPPK